MNEAETAKCILAAICFIPAALFIAANWVIFFHNQKNRRNNTDNFSSWVPLVGGLLAALACAIVPIPELKRLWWVSFIVDYGCIIGLVETAFYWSKSKK